MNEHLYHPIMYAYLHQNQLMWSFAKTLLTIETAILSASYFLSNNKSYLVLIILIIGTILIKFVYNLFNRAMDYRDKWFGIFNILVDKAGVDTLVKKKLKKMFS